MIMKLYYYEIIACELAKCQTAMLFKRTRKREVVYARQMCMYYRHKHLNLSQSVSGARYDRDHATVLHAVRTLDNLSLTDKDVKETFDGFISRSNEAKIQHEKDKTKKINEKIGNIGFAGYIHEVITRFTVLAYYLDAFTKGYGDEKAIRGQLASSEGDIQDLYVLFRIIEEGKEEENGITD